MIVTVDNGIASIDEAVHISDLGMDLIITDHHQIGEQLPKALAVVNPYRTENNIKFRDICGVGVAFKLACALYGDTDDMLYQYADLAAIGTIADVVPLLGENRGFVKAGLELINSESRVGVAELKKSLRVRRNPSARLKPLFRFARELMPADVLTTRQKP